LAKKQSGSSIERARQKSGAITPPDEQEERTNYHKARQPQVFLGQSIVPPLETSSLSMVQDGGTGASLKRVFIQQEALGLPIGAQSDQTSNYGGMSSHGVAQQSY